MIASDAVLRLGATVFKFCLSIIVWVGFGVAFFLEYCQASDLTDWRTSLSVKMQPGLVFRFDRRRADEPCLLLLLKHRLEPA